MSETFTPAELHSLALLVRQDGCSLRNFQGSENVWRRRLLQKIDVVYVNIENGDYLKASENLRLIRETVVPSHSSLRSREVSYWLDSLESEINSYNTLEPIPITEAQ